MFPALTIITAVSLGVSVGEVPVTQPGTAEQIQQITRVAEVASAPGTTVGDPAIGMPASYQPNHPEETIPNMTTEPGTATGNQPLATSTPTVHQPEAEPATPLVPTGPNPSTVEESAAIDAAAEVAEEVGSASPGADLTDDQNSPGQTTSTVGAKPSRAAPFAPFRPTYRVFDYADRGPDTVTVGEPVFAGTGETSEFWASLADSVFGGSTTDPVDPSSGEPEDPAATSDPPAEGPPPAEDPPEPPPPPEDPPEPPPSEDPPEPPPEEPPPPPEEPPPPTGNIAVQAVTDPPAAADSFSIAASFTTPFLIGDAGNQTFEAPAPGEHWVAADTPIGWDGSGICTSDLHSDPIDPASIHLKIDEAVVCTFTFVARASVLMETTVVEETPVAEEDPVVEDPPEPLFAFELRRGSSAEEPGEILATADRGPAGLFDLLCAEESSAADCVDVESEEGSRASLPPGTYQLCETARMPGWDNNLDGFVPAEDDGATECVEVLLEAGSETSVVVQHLPPPGGIAHMPAFWLVWNSCVEEEPLQPVLDETLAAEGPIPLGNAVVGSCEAAVALLGGTDLDGVDRSENATYRLGVQLLTARLNLLAGAGSCETADKAADAAQELLETMEFDGRGPGTTDPELLEQATGLTNTLDDFNRRMHCDEQPGPPIELPLAALLLPLYFATARIGRHRKTIKRNTRR